MASEHGGWHGGLCAGRRWIVVALLAASMTAVAVAEPGKPQQQAQAVPGAGPRRVLAPPVGLPAKNRDALPVVLIYYANETAPDAEEARHVADVAGWLRAADHPELAARAEVLESELRSFPEQVDEEAAAIKAGHAAAGAAAPGVLIVTNRLARDGHVEFATAEAPGVFQVSDLALPANRAGLYRCYPLAARESLDAVLLKAAELFDPAGHDFVLVTKSHGTPELALTTFYQSVADEAEPAAFVAHAREIVDRQLAYKLRDARPLSAGQAGIADGGGRRLLEQDGMLYWERVGKLQARADEAGALYLTDRAGRAFLDGGGQRVEVVGDRLRLGESGGQELNIDGQPAKLLAMVARHWPDDASDADGEARIRWPAFYPLLRTPALEAARLVDGRLVIEASATERLAIPLLAAGDVEAAGDGAWAAHLAASRLLLERAEVPVVDGDEIIAPLIEVGAPIPPLLAINKWIGDARLGADTDSTLDPDSNDTLDPDSNDTLSPDENTTLSPDENSTLSPEENSTLSPDENSTLSPDENSTLDRDSNDTLDPDNNDTLDPDNNDTLGLGEEIHVAADGTFSADVAGVAPSALRFGVTKGEYFAALEQAHASRQMFFRLVFVESCQSELGESAVGRWQTADAPAFAGEIWTSDGQGLKLSTIDYAEVFGLVSESADFGAAARSALMGRFDEEERRREVLK